MTNGTYPTIPNERADDLHNLKWADSADLVLFMAGNQFMALDELICAFQENHPEVRRIFFETLPPGLELKQILSGGAYFMGEFLSVYPDVYASVNEKAMITLADCGHINEGGYFLYLKNRLALMVRAGNPAGITGVSDLVKPGIRISQPNPEYEDIGHHILHMYRDSGGDKTVKTIMETKKEAGETVLTVVHHRETPERVAAGAADVGPVWATECLHAAKSGLPVEMIDVGPERDQHERINYYICRLNKGLNTKNAETFLAFIRSETAAGIYEKHGFTAVRPDVAKVSGL